MQAIQAMGGIKLQWDRNQPWKGARPFRERDTPIQDAPTKHYGQSGIRDLTTQTNYYNIEKYNRPNLEGFKSATVSILTMSESTSLPIFSNW